MVNKIKFSLVVPTFGRKYQLGRLLLSLSEQDFDLNEFEVIIIDQNNVIELDNIIERYSNSLIIRYFKISYQGCSKAKNIGISKSVGDYISFPDDDCIYYPDTLRNAAMIFESVPGIDYCFGRIVDRKKNISIIRKWKNVSYKINKINLLTTYTSITLFTKNLSVLGFDEFLGPPSSGSEDLDLCYKLIVNNLTGYYFPHVEVWHCELRDRLSDHKVKSYAKSFGYFCRKYLSFFTIIVILISVFIQIFRILMGILQLRKGKIKHSFSSLIYRVAGFLRYSSLIKKYNSTPR